MTAGAVIAPTTTADAAINAKSKAAVAAGYLNNYAKAVATPTGWTGSTSTCEAGQESAQSRAATLTAVNYARSLAGLSAVQLNPSYNAKAQAAALVYSAQGDLSHEIPKSWPCYTSDASTAGRSSNIAIGYAGAASITGYLDDAGSGNEVVGHRRWILYPATTTIGTGSTDNTNALWILGKQSKSAKNPTWVSWPTAGYFPSQLEPDGRWSLSGNTSFGFSFGSAKISVKNAAGKSLKVTKKYSQTDGFGNDTLVWEVKGVSAPTGTQAVSNYTVKVSNIKKKGSAKKISYSYKVQMFDPTAS